MLPICGQNKYQAQYITLTQYFCNCSWQWICFNFRRALKWNL